MSDAGIIDAAPKKHELEDTLEKLSIGVNLELWWQPRRVWYRGQVTDSWKNHQFVKILCKLGNGHYDHNWYHTEHIKFRNFRPQSSSASKDQLKVNLPMLSGGMLGTSPPKLSKENQIPNIAQSCNLKWPSFLSPFSPECN